MAIRFDAGGRVKTTRKLSRSRSKLRPSKVKQMLYIQCLCASWWCCRWCCHCCTPHPFITRRLIWMAAFVCAFTKTASINRTRLARLLHVEIARPHIEPLHTQKPDPHSHKHQRATQWKRQTKFCYKLSTATIQGQLQFVERIARTE